MQATKFSVVIENTTHGRQKVRPGEPCKEQM